MPLLKELATIRAGYPFRGAIEPDTMGQIKLIQIKDVSSNGLSAYDQLTSINLPDISTSHFINKDEVLFMSRGTKRQATAITEELPNTIAVSQFFIIKCSTNLIAQYLAWYINQKLAQRYFDEHSRGTVIPMITKDVLANLPLPLPPLAVQRKIVQVYQLSLKEQSLMVAIQEKRSQLVEMALLAAIERKVKP
jgi:restriction endonuclease S subunit